MNDTVIQEAIKTCQTAAIAAAQWVGRGQQDAADQAAVTAMRNCLAYSLIQARVVIGEGERDEAPMLFIGEQLGRGDQESAAVDIAVDPLEGTGLCAYAAPGALALLAMAPRNTLLHAPDIYMDKIAVGPAAQGAVDIDRPVADNLSSVAKRLNRPVDTLTVCILDRPRHQEIIKQVRQTGARVQLIADGDVAASILTCMPHAQVHMVLGSGGAPEGVLAACALKSLQADMQGRLLFANDQQLQRCQSMMPNQDPKRKLTLNDLVQQEAVFAATGVTSGNLLPGVQQQGHRSTTYTLLLSTQQQTQWICQQHPPHHDAVNPHGWLQSPFAVS
ncbi:MAG: class II fructose-bisphosphatase [Myxococcota bacterium]